MSTLKGCYKDVKNLIQCLDPVVAQCQVTVSMSFSDPRISPPPPAFTTYNRSWPQMYRGAWLFYFGAPEMRQ